MKAEIKYRNLGTLLQVVGGLTVFFMVTKPTVHETGHYIFGGVGLLVAFFGRLIQAYGDEWFDWFEDD